VVVVGTVLTVGACGLVAVIVNAMSLSATNRETTQAANAAKQVLEHLRGTPSDEVFAAFNCDASDDPEGEGTAPGDNFVMRGSGNPDGSGVMVAEVHFPVDVNTGALREDVNDPLLGMPRDLNGDGAIDALDHSGDYVVLPVKVRIRWSGVTGLRTFELCTVLTNR
jgi:hypothetical protein